MAKVEFKDTGRSFYADCGDFGISYNPNTGALGDFFAGDESGEETALCKDGRYYILNGDFREKYSELGTFDECIAFFLKNEDLHSSWSNTYKQP